MVGADAPVLGPGLGEPLALWVRDLDAAPGPGVRALRFEYSSRGDRVPGILLLPADRRPPFPLVLLQHGAGGSKEADYLDAARLPWVRGGAAVASIDFPLHGERANAKLGARLLAAIAARSSDAADAQGAALLRDFTRQALHDLGRALDALETRPEIDPDRVAYAAFSLGAILGALFCPGELRLRAAALALAGGGLGPGDLDPARHIRGFAGRPLLLVNATRDERIPRAAAEALHAAAPEPKQIAWFESGHSNLPGRALKAMWTFLARELGIEAVR
jgi:dienelactone hydrolase